MSRKSRYGRRLSGRNPKGGPKFTPEQEKQLLHAEQLDVRARVMALGVAEHLKVYGADIPELDECAALLVAASTFRKSARAITAEVRRAADPPPPPAAPAKKKRVRK